MQITLTIDPTDQKQVTALAELLTALGGHAVTVGGPDSDAGQYKLVKGSDGRIKSVKSDTKEPETEEPETEEPETEEPETEEPETEEPETEEPETEEQQAEEQQAEEPKSVTLSDIRTLAAPMLKTSPEAKDLFREDLAKFKATSVSNLDPDKYEDFYAVLKSDRYKNL